MMQSKPDAKANTSGVRPQNLDGLMSRINRDVEAQAALIERNPSAAASADELLDVLKEAKRRVEILAKSRK